MSDAASRKSIIETCLAMGRSGLTPGKSGNVSIRTEDSMLITPTGLPYEALTPPDIVSMSLDGVVSERSLAPSSEWRFHAAIYRERPEANAVVHTHSRYATALACARREIPSFHYMVAMAGGDSIRCADYATFGTEALAQNAVAALANGRRACLLANHGQIAFGPSIEKALALAFEVEHLAAQYCASLAIGGPVLLDAEEMKTNLEKFKTYGPARVADA
jgi:L-fuculose-phosphate aldolase